ncbi:polyphosphate kinase 2 family protein [Xanthobacter agilis]|jgi:PPK2 family polyphosphate:nucleotide phosphotransferase|uniref:PPK2 family polyphosphate:nucleotide phosphotransferase n=1 Tax=Xanthobacter agilis TaxID=47492 RepID=A0ABU0LHV3_XANAG|nr:polyphosphate kinase 2 family protein [Xanthobacter agilis]MDQ0506712.1 PPK2 family polyphosphate:nucleotide phosphotransferase [Xanthobacter agilis]
MGLRKKLVVEPGTRVRLKDVDAAFHGDYASAELAKDDLAKNVVRLAELQQKLYGEKKHALLVVLQGIDAAGKDGTCWHVMAAMNPQGTSVTGFKQPTAEEHQHDFLWRVHPHAPGLGEVAVFNRSHYEDVLVVRVHDLVPKEVWSERYDIINDFETLLTTAGVTILKFFLYITPEEQLARFAQRLDDPARQWKISEADYKERAFWDQYIAAYEDMLAKCSTKHAPWYVIPSNHKWFRNLAVSKIIEETLDEMNLKLPAPTVDLEQIRKDYHQAVKAEKGKA